MAEGGWKIDRREEAAMMARYTPEKVKRVMTEAARAGGMGPPSLGPGDRRIPWQERLARLDAVLKRYMDEKA